MTIDEMCKKCKEKFKDNFDIKKCDDCISIQFVSLIDEWLDILDDIRNKIEIEENRRKEERNDLA